MLLIADSKFEYRLNMKFYGRKNGTSFVWWKIFIKINDFITIYDDSRKLAAIKFYLARDSLRRSSRFYTHIISEFCLHFIPLDSIRFLFEFIIFVEKNILLFWCTDNTSIKFINRISTMNDERAITWIQTL